MFQTDLYFFKPPILKKTAEARTVPKKTPHKMDAWR